MAMSRLDVLRLAYHWAGQESWGSRAAAFAEEPSPHEFVDAFDRLDRKEQLAVTRIAICTLAAENVELLRGLAAYCRHLLWVIERNDASEPR